MTAKYYSRLEKLGQEQLQRLVQYHQTASETGLRVLSLLLNLIDRLRIWARTQTGNDDDVEDVLGTCANFDGLAGAMVEKHRAEIQKQGRNLAIVMEALSAYQDSMFVARGQSCEANEAAERNGGHGGRSASHPLTCTDVAELVEGIARLAARDLLARVAIVSQVQRAISEVDASRSLGTVQGAQCQRSVEELGILTQQWRSLHMGRRAEDATAGGRDGAQGAMQHHGQGGVGYATEAGDADLAERVSLLSWKLTGKSITAWLEEPTH